VAGTLVTLASGQTPIEEVEVGDRVRTLDESACDTSGGRFIAVEVELVVGGQGTVTLLQPAGWLDDANLTVGDWLDVSGAEHGEASGPIRAAWPVEVSPGSGCLVVATSALVTAHVLDVELNDGERMGTTLVHPFYSLDRGLFVAAGDLRTGERLVDRFGQTRQVASLELRPETTIVYNLAVADAHSYFAGDGEVWVHNGTECPGTDGQNGNLRPDPNAEGAHSTYRRNRGTGNIDHYATWTPQTNFMNPAPWQQQIRGDVTGPAHFNRATGSEVATPHAHDPTAPGGVRPMLPNEIPGRQTP
jgi:hypothetical protein